MAVKQLLFVDTNIWLDFYRARNETGLRLLEHLEAISDRLIVTYQVESEFKTNRQRAIEEGLRELKPPTQVPRLGIFSDAAATRVMSKSQREVEKRVKNLTKRLGRVLDNPALHDPVYKICQRIFHKNDGFTLSREDKVRRVIRRQAFRRFLHGCPPRKKNDTSIGDAINWEWIVRCAGGAKPSDVVIVSRDSDYGITIGDKSYINDHLRQEFGERVSKRRKLLLFPRLSEALKLFRVDISPQEEAVEQELVKPSHTLSFSRNQLVNMMKAWEANSAKLLEADPRLEALFGDSEDSAES